MSRPAWENNGALEWFARRSISAATVERNAIRLEVVRFPHAGDEGLAFVFPLVRDGMEVGCIYRRQSLCRRDGEDVLFGLGNIDPESDTLILTGNEIDALSFHEIGAWNALSVPHSALPEKDEAGCLWASRDALAAAQRVILALPGDDAGKALEYELARRIGRAKCWRVEWPTLIGDIETKDANEVLVQGGSDLLKEVLDNAKPLPIRSLYDVDAFGEQVEALYHGRLKVGVSTGWEEIDKLMLPRPGDFSVITGYPGAGKALATDTPIPTPNGWTTMGRLRVGSVVYDENGMECRVTRVSPVMKGRPCYRIKLMDGTEIIADAEHQWYSESLRAKVSDRHHRRTWADGRERPKPRGTDQAHKRTFYGTVTTEQIAADLRYADKWNHRFPVAQPLVGRPKHIPFPPYTLGAWLGDGSSDASNITCADPEIVSEIRLDGFIVERNEKGSKGRGKASLYVIRTMGQAYQYRSRRGGRERGASPLSPLVMLREVGVLGDKHIPPAYLRADRDTRLALLCGLMDTDGYCDPKGQVEYCSTSEKLAYGVWELMLSLGIRATIRASDATLYGKVVGRRWRVCGRPLMPVFRIRRKLARQNFKSRHSHYRSVVACDPVPSVPVRCIQVDSPSSLFLCSRSFVPTHNSQFIDCLCLNLARLHGWTFAVASFENPPEEHIASLVRSHLGMPFHDGPTRRMTEAELAIGMKWLGKHFHFIRADDESPTLDWLLEAAEAAVMRYGINGLVIDPYNELDHHRPVGMTETEYVSQMLGRLRRFAQLTDCHVFFVAHPAKPPMTTKDQSGPGLPPPTLFNISGSAHWTNKADLGIVVHRPWQDDGTQSLSTEIHLKKIRRQPVMGRPGMKTLLFNPTTGRYS